VDKEKRDWIKQALRHKTLTDLNKQDELTAEHTGVNTQGIMGKMGDTWRGGGDNHKRKVKQIRV
jgi:hypothetical protein